MDMLKRVFTGEIKGIDEKERSVTAYISTKGRDRMDEVLEPAGVRTDKYLKNPIVLFAHDYQSPPIGKALWLKTNTKGIISKVQFANTEFANEIFNLYKDGFMKAFSVGFIPEEWEDGDGKKSPSRTYKKWELLEYSAVPVPANGDALTLAMQKGVLKNETLKEMFGLKKDEEPPEEEEPEEEDEGEEQKTLDELLAENEVFKGIIAEQENAIKALNLELYKVYLLNHKEIIAEVSDDELARKVGEVVNGVIRQMQGKVD